MFLFVKKVMKKLKKGEKSPTLNLPYSFSLDILLELLCPKLVVPIGPLIGYIGVLLRDLSFLSIQLL